MTKIFRQSGDVVRIPSAPATGSAGSIVEVGDLVGVAQADYTSGNPVDLCLTGVHELPKAADTVTQGQALYHSGGSLTTTESTNKLAGHAAAAAASGDATVLCRLFG